MSPSAATAEPLRAVDPTALARWRQRLAGTEPWLHGEVGRRLADKLAVIRREPAVVLDWGWEAPPDAARLREAYPRATLRVVGTPGVAPPATPWWNPSRWRARPTPLDPAEVAPGSAQLLWSNMWLHAQADPRQVLRAWHAALAVDGFLMFTTLGPGTLDGLRALYAAQGWPAPHAPFVDMHDLGDMLVEAGFADPVMDQETLTLTWPDGAAALTELRGLGGNADPQRFAGLRTPRWRDRLVDRLAQDPGTHDGSRTALRFEIVYGHAFRPLPRPRVAPQTTVDLEDMRSILRARPGA
jgi:malonyl-CoA O-methyltransferase